MNKAVLVLLAVPCASGSSMGNLPHGIGEKVVEFCVSSRWGFSCFDASATGSRAVIARAGIAGLGKMVGRSALATVGVVVVREAFRDIDELRRSKGVALQRLLDGPVLPSAAMAPAVGGSEAAAPTETAAADADVNVAEPAEGTLGSKLAPVEEQPADAAAQSPVAGQAAAGAGAGGAGEAASSRAAAGARN